jgi:hypothetical protein
VPFPVGDGRSAAPCSRWSIAGAAGGEVSNFSWTPQGEEVSPAHVFRPKPTERPESSGGCRPAGAGRRRRWRALAARPGRFAAGRLCWSAVLAVAGAGGRSVAGIGEGAIPFPTQVSGSDDAGAARIAFPMVCDFLFLRASGPGLHTAVMMLTKSLPRRPVPAWRCQAPAGGAGS